MKNPFKNRRYGNQQYAQSIPAMAAADSEMLEVIVKFNGDLTPIAEELNAVVEILAQGYAIITLPTENIIRLYSYPQIENIELPKAIYTALSQSLSSACINAVQSPSQYNLQGNGVIVAVIDSGIDYTHLDFRNPDGTTRILWLWDQMVDGSPPEGFPSGSEYSREQLNEALATDNPRAIIPSVDTIGHGTAVAGIAAGNGREGNGQNIGVAPNADLLIVKLGRRGVQSFATTTELMRAVKYVIYKSRSEGKPVAINISLGMNNGSHLGDSIFETYLSDISMEWKVSIIVPTGNEGSAGHHYSGRIASNQTREIEFFTASGIESFFISLWKNFVDSFSVELIFSNGVSSGVVGIESQVKNVRVNNLILTIIYGQPTHYSVSQEIYFYVRAEEGFIDSGVWRLRIIATTIVDGNFEMWLPTTEQVTAKTHFSSPATTRTMTIPSTAQRVIAVAGYNDRVGNITEFSGRGSTNPVLPNPDITAPSVGIYSARTGGGYDSFTGTSMAAPFVTGSAALMMQWGIVNKNDPFLYGERIKAFLRLGARRSGDTTYPNYVTGYGMLCLSSTMSYLERYKWGDFNSWLQRI